MVVVTLGGVSFIFRDLLEEMFIIHCRCSVGSGAGGRECERNEPARHCGGSLSIQ